MRNAEKDRIWIEQLWEETNTPASILTCLGYWITRAQQLESRAREWVSVEERLPEEGQEVDILVDTGGEYPSNRTTEVQYDDGGFYHEMCRGKVYVEDRVTHWMPLPEPPK